MAGQVGVLVEVDAPVAGGGGELRLVDAHLAQHALEQVDPAGRQRHLRDVALGLVAGQAGQLGRQLQGLAGGHPGDDHLPPPAPELDHQRHVVAGGDVLQAELAVRSGEGVHQRRAAGLGAAAGVAGDPGPEGLDRGVGDVDDGVVDRIGRAEAGRRRRHHGAGHQGGAAGRAVEGLAQAQVGAAAGRVAAHAGHARAAAGVVAAAAAAVDAALPQPSPIGPQYLPVGCWQVIGGAAGRARAQVGRGGAADRRRRGRGHTRAACRSRRRCCRRSARPPSRRSGPCSRCRRCRGWGCRPPPQTPPLGQSPQSSILPQPSPILPQKRPPGESQVLRVQAGAAGADVGDAAAAADLAGAGAVAAVEQAAAAVADLAAEAPAR